MDIIIYGNLLQNYAVQQVLLNYADTVDTIWHDRDQSCIPGSYHLTWKEMIKFILNRNDFRTFYHKQHLACEIARQKKNQKWSNQYIHIRKDVTDLHDNDNDYDYFVVGSDQVWNPYF